MKDRLIRIGKWFTYPAFYLVCLGLFGYLTFPYEKLKDRIIAEFERKAKPGQRLEIGKISSYWFSGVEFTGVKLTLPPDGAGAGGLGYAHGSGDAFGAPAASPGAKESVITLDEGHARVRLLPLLIGRVRLDFWVSAFDGEISGTVPIGSSGGEIVVQLSKVELAKIEPLAQAIGGIPIRGTVDGKLDLDVPEGKLVKATGALELTVDSAVISDGKTKIQGLLELPAAKLGTLTVTAEAKEGGLKITKLAAQGPDIELVGDGRVTMKDPWNESQADLYLRFKFTDAYRTKNDITKSLLGEPGSTVPALMEMQVPKMTKAKRPDGFYGWHMHGSLKSPKFDPSATDTGPAALATVPGKSPVKKDWKKPAGLNFPFGGSTATHDDAPPSPPPPSPPPPSPAVAPAPPPPTRGAPPEMDPVRIQPPPEAPAAAPPPPEQPAAPPPEQPAPPPDPLAPVPQ